MKRKFFHYGDVLQDWLAYWGAAAVQI